MRYGTKKLAYVMKSLLLLTGAAALMLAFSLSVHAAANGGNIRLWRGDSYRLTAGMNGKKTWRSMNPGIATVNSNGWVKAVGTGTAVISVTNGSSTTQFVIKVRKPGLNYTSVRIKEKTSFTLSLGGGLPAAWSTGNKKTAVVSGGVVTAKKPGTVWITARYAGYNYRCKVTVYEDTTIRRLTISNTAVSMVERRSKRLDLTVKPAKLQYLAKKARWTTSNKKVVKVDGGVLKAVKPGTAVVTVILQNITLSCNVTVLRDTKISSVSELFDIDNEAGTFYLTKDLNISGSTRKLKNLRCTLYGGGHQITVSDRSCLADKNYGTITNLDIKGGAAVRINYGTIQNCDAYGTLNVDDGSQVQYGFAETNLGTVSRCENHRDIRVVRTDLPANACRIAGIVMVNRGLVEKCSNTGAMYSPKAAAGIVLTNQGNINDCSNAERVDGKNGCGITYFNYGRMNNCVNTGKADYAFSVPGKTGILKDGYYLAGMSADKSEGQISADANVRRVVKKNVSDEAYFPTLRFDTVWKMTDSGPKPR